MIIVAAEEETQMMKMKREDPVSVFRAFETIAEKELYAEVFEDADALHLLEGFASHHGADFYGRPRNDGAVTLMREEWTAPAAYAFGDAEVVPLRAGGTIRWRVVNGENPG